MEDYEVLVGDINRLRWVPLSGKFHLSDLGYRPVEGGHESNGTRIYVAKAPHKGAVHPGKVGDGWDGTLTQYFSLLKLIECCDLLGAYIPYDNDEKLIKVCIILIFLLPNDK